MLNIKKKISILLLISLVLTQANVSVFAEEYNNDKKTEETIVVDDDTLDIDEDNNINISDVLINENADVVSENIINNDYENTKNKKYEEEAEQDEENGQKEQDDDLVLSTLSEIDYETDTKTISTESEIEEISVATESEIIDDEEVIITSMPNDATISELDEYNEKFGKGYFSPSLPVEPLKRSEDDTDVDIFGDTTLPEKYDSRNYKNKHNMSILSEVRNQGGYGLCWSFSLIGLIETYLRKLNIVDNEADADLSEAALGYFVFNLENITSNADNLNKPKTAGSDYQKIVKGRTWENFGYHGMGASLMMSSFLGAVKENDDTKYDNMENIKQNGLDPKYAYNSNAYEIDDCLFINKNDIDEIKKAIMEYGAVGIAFDEDQRRKDETCHEINGEHYCYGTQNRDNHAVNVVGWDDTIPKNYFYNSYGEVASRNGGWLVRNNYGHDNLHEKDGYFWLSYEDQTMDDTVYAVKARKANKYKYNYRYDSTGKLAYDEIIDDPDYIVGNLFKVSSEEDQTLDAVNVVFHNANTDFVIEVYTNDQKMQNIADGTKVLSQNAHLNLAGIYTIELDKKIELKKDTYFSVCIRNTGTERIQIMLDNITETEPDPTKSYEEIMNYYNNAEYGQSFKGWINYDQYKDRNTSLKTVNGKTYGVNYRIKALTNGNKSYTFPSNWFNQLSSLGKSKSDITEITFVKDESEKPVLYDESFDIPDSNGLKGFISGTKVYIYAPSKGTIYAPEDSSYLFSESSLTGSAFTKLQFINNLDLLDTSKVKNMEGMFKTAKSLDSVDLSNFNTSKVEDMSHMFYFCLYFDKLDVSKFDTSNVSDMSYMFFNCTGLSSLDVRNFDTKKVTTMESMFASCQNVTSLDVSKFNTSNVVNMCSMFSNCYGLSKMDLTNFDTSKVTDMEKMFYCMQKSETELEILDLSSFDTSNVENMAQMFYQCRRLKTIYAKDTFVTTKVVGQNKDLFMFSDCTNLVGGNKTTYTADHIDKLYARLDKINQPGYFTSTTVISNKTISFDLLGHGSNISDITVEKGTKVMGSDIPKDPTDKGYIFSGWYKNYDSTKANLDERFTNLFDFTKDIVSEDLKLFAKWVPITYTIKFDVSKFALEIPNKLKTYGEEFVIPNPTGIVSGYTFDGWFRDNTYTTKAENITNDINTEYTADNGKEITLYARWKARITYNVNGHGSISPEYVDVVLNDTTVLPTLTDVSGFVFDTTNSWYLESTLNTLAGKAGSNYKVVEPKVLYAKWDKSDYGIVYKINDENGEELKDTTLPVTINKTGSVTIPEPTARKGYTFVGWVVNDFIKNKYAPTDAYYKGSIEINGSEVSKDLIFVSKWEGNEYTITIDANGGGKSQDDKEQVDIKSKHGESITLGSNHIISSRSEYYLSSYNTKSDGSGISYSTTQSYTDIGGDILDKVTIYCIWAIKQQPAPTTNNNSSNNRSSSDRGDGGTGGGSISVQAAQSQQAQQQQSPLNQNQPQTVEQRVESAKAQNKVDTYQVNVNMVRTGTFVLDKTTNKMKFTDTNVKSGFYNIDVGNGAGMYCIDENGNMKTGFVEYKGDIYYMDERQANFGKMLVGQIVLNGYNFVFDAFGKCVGGKENYEKVLYAQAQQSMQQSLTQQSPVLVENKQQTALTQATLIEQPVNAQPANKTVQAFSLPQAISNLFSTFLTK